MQVLIGLVLTGAALVLAMEPVRWLVGTWSAPGYEHYPAWVFAGVCALFVWSVTSERVLEGSALPERRRTRRMALVLLGATFAIRLASQLLAINVVGAFALAIDVYALALLFGVRERRRALSPGWLAVLFLFCLPVEPMFQRSVGYLLQQVSAVGACGLLGFAFDPVSCSGTRLLVMGREVLVDVPCSGSRLLTSLLLVLSLGASLARPGLVGSALGLGVALLSAWLANTARITLLAVGIVFRDLVGLDVMAAPWHELIGLACLSAAAGPILAWTIRVWQDRTLDEPDADRVPVPASRSAALRGTAGSLALAGVALIAALLIVSVDPRPIDSSGPVAAPELPFNLSGYPARPGTLSADEARYFTRYGGQSARAAYGPFSLLLVRTTSPLRHLHAPDVCLEGAGHAVRYLSARFSGAPTAFYRSVDPAGDGWHIRVSFVSERGRVATSVSEVVWYWLQSPGDAWTMVQRISPESAPADQFERWDASVARAYNLNS